MGDKLRRRKAASGGCHDAGWITGKLLRHGRGQGPRCCGKGIEAGHAQPQISNDDARLHHRADPPTGPPKLGKAVHRNGAAICAGEEGLLGAAELLRGADVVRAGLAIDGLNG